MCNCFGISILGVLGNCYWDHFPGCKGNPSLSSPAPVSVSIKELHLHSGDYTYTLNLTSKEFPKKVRLRLHLQ